MNPFRGIVRMFQAKILLPGTINIPSLHVNKKNQICIVTVSFIENIRVDDSFFSPFTFAHFFSSGGSQCLVPGNGWTIYPSPQGTQGGQVRGTQISTESYKQMKVRNQASTT